MDKKGAAGKGKAKKLQRVATVADAPPPAAAAAAAEPAELTEEEAREASAAAVAKAVQERQQLQQQQEHEEESDKDEEEHEEPAQQSQPQEADVAASAAPEQVEEAQPEPTPAAEVAAGIAALKVEPEVPAAVDVPASAPVATPVAPVAAAAAPAVAAPVVAAPAVAQAEPVIPSFSTVDLLDWKVAEEKGSFLGGAPQYVTFLFEICYRYPAEVLRVLQRDLQAEGLDPETFPPVANVVLAKRYAEFYDFHEQLEKHFVCLPPFPDKTLSTLGRRTDKEFVSARAAALHHYLAQVLQRADIEKSGWPRQFFGAPSPAQHLRNEREKAAARRQQQHILHDGHDEPIIARSQPRATSSSVSHAGVTAAAPSVHFDSALDGGAEVEVDASIGGGDRAFGGVSSLPSAAHLAAAIDQEDEDEEPFIGSEANSLVEPSLVPQAVAQASSSAQMHEEDDFHRRLQASSSSVGVPLSKSPSMASPSSLASLAPAPSLREAYAAYTKSAPAFPPPRSALLQFVTSSNVFDMLRGVMVDAHTLLVLAADRSVVAKATSFFSALFGGVGSGKKTEDKAAGETTTYTSTSGEQIANPRGALYAFRRASAPVDDGRINSPAAAAAQASDFVQTLSIFFPGEVSDLRWDAERRWIYVSDQRGQVSIFNPSSDFDYAVKIASAPAIRSRNPADLALAAPPIVAMTFAPSPPPAPGVPVSAAAMAPAALMLACSVDDGDRQYLTRFDLHEQRADSRATLQFNAPRSVNQNETLHALEWDAAQKRLLVASSGRVISMYDCAAQPGAPPTLLHRLLNGHEDAVTVLALDPSPQLLLSQGRANITGMLASGGADGAVLLWNLGLKGAERTSTIWARLKAHEVPVTALAWSAPIGGGFGSNATAAAAEKQSSVAGRYLASGDELGHVCVWDARRRGCIMAFKAHNDAVRSVQITSTAPLTLVTTSDDKSAKIWQLL